MKYLKHILFAVVFLVACSDSPRANGDRVMLIHMNDTYRIDAVEEGRSGGFARVATLIKNLQSDGNTVAVTHGGDFLFPSLESQLWSGMQIVEALNFLDGLAPMYVVPGNHEFDPRTADPAIAAINASTFTWVADNMHLATGVAEVDQALESSFITDIGGHRVGFVALTLLPEHGGNDRDFAPVTGGYLETAERVLAELDQQDVDVIVGLTHLHLADDRLVAKLKARYPKFVLIVGGHEHEPEFEQGDDDNAMIVKGASNARVVWQLELDLSEELPRVNATRIDVDESIAEDADYLLIANRWRERLIAKIPFLPSRVGEAALPLDAREVTIRNVESNWANFIVDQMRAAFGQPMADLAFVNSGTLRIDDFIAEDITFEDIGRTFGFSSFLRYMTIRGDEFRTLLEAGYRGEGPSKGYFPQVSGFRVCVDRRFPDGERIVSLQVPNDGGWQEIEDDKEYSLVAPDFLYGGGDGYDFSAAENVSRPGSELKYLVLDGVIRAQAQNIRIGNAVDPNNPRIVIIDENRNSCWPAGYEH